VRELVHKGGTACRDPEHAAAGRIAAAEHTAGGAACRDGTGRGRPCSAG